MGKLEKESAVRRRKANVRSYVLGAVAVAGVVGLAVVAPNALILLRAAGIKPHARQEEVIKRSTRELVQKGFLEWKDDRVRLTPRGRHAYEMEQATMRLKNAPRRWDRKWRMFIFDIPERRKKARHMIRQKMLEVGFVRVQDSVWAYPYDCEDFAALLKADLKIGKDLLYLIVDTMEGDTALRTYFKLPQST